jgi:hypothetical protein
LSAKRGTETDVKPSPLEVLSVRKENASSKPVGATETEKSTMMRYVHRRTMMTLSTIERQYNSQFTRVRDYFLQEQRNLIKEFLKVRERIEALDDAKGGAGPNEALARLIKLVEQKKDTALMTTIDAFKRSSEQSVASVVANLEQSIKNAQKTQQADVSSIMEQIELFKQSANSADALRTKLDDIDLAFNAIIKEISDQNTKFKEDMVGLVNYVMGDGLAGKFIESLHPELKEDIVETAQNLKDTMNKKDSRLISYYKLNYSIMDLIMDPQFFLMYLIKGLRILFAYVSLFLATRMFSPMYETAVYDKQQNPPSLAVYTLLYLGLDAAFNTFLFVLLYLIRVLFKPADGDFIIDRHLFKKYAADYTISTLLLIALSNMIAIVITNKKYFRYKFEGLRAIRSFEQMMFYMACIIYIFPFFFIL